MPEKSPTVASLKAERVARARSSRPPAEHKAELSLRTLGGLVLYIRDQHGEPACRQILEAADLALADFDGRNRWASLEQVEAVLSLSRDLFPDDESFKHAFAHKLTEHLGPARYLAFAASPGMVFQKAFRSLDTLAAISRAEVLERGRAHLVVRYFSERAESRLLCLSRQGQAAALPTLWGLPEAVFEEKSCIGRGDDCCEYRISWYEHRRWGPLLLGTLAGGAAAFATSSLDASLFPTWATLPLLGLAIGHAYEVRRTNTAHLRVATEQQDALREVAREDSLARRELLELHRREQEWSRLLEEQLEERADAFLQVIRGLQLMEEEYRHTLQGVSHDIRNPLTILRMSLDRFAELVDPEDTQDAELLDDHREALGRIERLLVEVVQVATTQQGLGIGTPERVEVQEIGDMLRRRLKALTYGRDLRVSVFTTREAPDSITVDTLVFDRVLDNLLTNAVKYTDRGSIVLEVGGTPGFLTLKLSDTGRGVAPERIEQIFRPGGSAIDERAAHSLGVGLSVVVRLLARAGGRLEVMSKLGHGTTFWAHFPTKAPSDIDELSPDSSDELLRKVVRIRRNAPS